MMGIKLLYIFGCTCLFVWSLEASSNCDIDRTGLPTDTCTFDLLMKNAKPNRADQYMCSGYSVKDEILPDTTGQTYNEEYIVKFEALADAGTAHHILVFGCERAYRTQGSWNCGTVCEGKEQIIFAWAKNAPPLSLPKNVGRRIGSDSQINHIVIQVHYSKALAEPDTSGIRIYTTHQRQQFLAGIYLLLAYDVVIPPNTEKTHADISCRFNWPDSIVPFGYRTHAHTLGKVISGYKVAGNDYQLIGKGNPQWPQAFYPVENPIQIQPGDMLAARCTFNSIGRNRKTYIGSTSDDEMCNFYIMYYTNATSEGQGPDTCAGNNIPQVFNYIPADSDTPLPPNPDLENVAHSHHHHTSMPAANEESEQHNMQGKVMDTPPANQNIKGNNKGSSDSGSNSGSRFINGVRDSSRNGKSQSQEKTKLSTSYGNRVPGQAGFLRGQQLPNANRPPSYLFDVDYPENDYYDIMQERSRNKLKKPYYDLYDSQSLPYGYSDLPNDHSIFDKSYPTLSRNRNKNFNAKYDDYAADELLKNGGFSNSAGYGSRTRSKVKGSNSKASPRQGSELDESVTSKKGNTLSQAGSGLGLTFKSAVGTFDLGQVAGLAVGKTGDLYIFHRGEIVWNSLSFDLYGNYQYKDKPVDTDAIVVVNKDGNLVRSFGKNILKDLPQVKHASPSGNQQVSDRWTCLSVEPCQDLKGKRFYLPHGLTLDDKDNVWVTDVGLHQVFRLPRGQDKPDLTLGIRFEPGTDTEHFCKPSDVAVLSSGDFFVSDGYCNTRIMKFDKNGYFLQQWGKPSTSYGLDNYPLPGMFNLPHSLALAEDKNLLCVADRENGRIQCFNLNGTFMRQMHPAQIGETLYAVEYSPNHGGILFAVNGRSLSKDGPPVQGLTFDINNGVLLSTWNIPSKGLSNPHDVTVDDSRHLVYVGELNPTKVWKFEMDHSLYAANNSKTIVPTKPAESHTNAPVITDSGIGVTQLLSSKKTSTAKSVGVVSDDPIVSGSSIDVVLNAGIVQSPTVEKMEEDNFAPSLVIGMLLVVPVILLVAITVLIRLYHTGYFRSCNRRSNLKSKFNLGNFLNSHKGFDRLSTEDDDHDLDNALDDSDNEEFSIVRKA